MTHAFDLDNEVARIVREEVLADQTTLVSELVLEVDDDLRVFEEPSVIVLRDEFPREYDVFTGSDDEFFYHLVHELGILEYSDDICQREPDVVTWWLIDDDLATDINRALKTPPPLLFKFDQCWWGLEIDDEPNLFHNYVIEAVARQRIKDREQIAHSD